MPMRVLITGAAGNLGSLLAEHLLASNGIQLRLMIHHKPLSDRIRQADVEVVHADLGRRSVLPAAVDNVQVVVHFAGELFKPWPERFLQRTNVDYVCNLLQASTQSGVQRWILVSFPHVEGETNPERPATGRLDGKPESIHARTRLAAEHALFEASERSGMTAIVLRPGMIYARNVLMIEAGRWLMKRRLLPVWPRDTWIHLLSLPDFFACTEAAICKPDVSGVYNLGDDAPLTLQSFLDQLAEHWAFPRPRRMPWPLFPLAGLLTEIGAALARTPAPLTRDFVRIGRASYASDTSRMKADLIDQLAYPTLADGLSLL
jgi:nucleoside-diphosphate-sugar epimerase